MRFGNLDPDDDPFLHGMEKRKGQFEAGVGADLITPTPSGACGPPRM
jgi:outer membrane protein